MIPAGWFGSAWLGIARIGVGRLASAATPSVDVPVHVPADVCAVGVVDRIEDDVVVVEWCPAFIVDIPLAAFPGGVSEGDRLGLIALPLRAPPPSGGASASRTDGDGHPGPPPQLEQESPHAAQ